MYLLQGWEEVSRHMTGDQTEDNLGHDIHITVEKTNYRMKIYPQSAFVVCDQKWTSRYDDDVTEIQQHSGPIHGEKWRGEWKISFVSFNSGYGNMTDEYMTEEIEETRGIVSWSELSACWFNFCGYLPPWIRFAISHVWYIPTWPRDSW